MQGGATTQRRKSALTKETSPGKAPQQPQAPIPTATVKRRKWGTSPFDENWLNLDCCGLFCAFLTYSLHAYGCFAVVVLLIPPWMSFRDEEGVRHTTWMGKFHMVAFCAVAIFAVVSHWKAMTTDPGAVPPDATPLPELDEEEGTTTSTRGKRLCRRCHAYKPQRAHHCSVCKRCIIKMDHHCPWVSLFVHLVVVVRCMSLSTLLYRLVSDLVIAFACLFTYIIHCNRLTTVS